MKTLKLLVFFLCLCGFATTAVAQPPGEEPSEEAFIEAAQNASVQQFDPTLPAVSMLDWVNALAMPPSQATWEVNDCGEQTGAPADMERDFPVCVEAVFLVAPETRAHASIIVGTFQQGVVGHPGLFQLSVERGGAYQEVGKLSELGLLAK